jgi:hypothetical protein
MDTKQNEIHFQLSLFGGQIELAAFTGIVEQIQIALAENERAITGRKPHASWILDTAAIIPVAASPNGTSAEDLKQIIRETRNDFARVLPAGIEEVGGESRSPRARDAVQRILSFMGNDIQSIVVSGDEVDDVAIDFAAVERTGAGVVDPASDSQPLYTAGVYYEDIGTIEGIIDLVHTRSRKPRFSIRERWTKQHLMAEFDDQLMAHVTEALRLGRDVEVTGLIRFRGTGEPMSLREVTSVWWPDPEPADILTFEGVLPDLIGGMDEGDYIRELRSGENDDRS